MDSTWDCIVVGGGAAGLSAALVLGRARKRTLLVDAGRPSNAVAHGIGGLLGHDGRPPAELYAAGRAEAVEYPTVEVRAGEVAGGTREDGVLVLDLADGSAETARRVLLATGMDYRYPDLPGMAERWGRSVFHCPFCHGWEVRDRALGVLDPGASGVHRSLLLREWSDDVTLLTNGPTALEGTDLRRLAAAGVQVDERPIAAVDGPGEELSEVAFADGGERACGGLLVVTTMHQRSTLAAGLGADLAEPGPVSAGAVVVDHQFATTAPGVSAAGDVSVQMPSIPAAIMAGNTAAAMLVGLMMLDDRGLVHA